MREAAGYILYHGRGDHRRFLLLRNRRHGTWSFPKGHLEPGETPEEGAARELREETGIAGVRRLPDFEEVLEYEVPPASRDEGGPPYRKRLHLFLAESADPTWAPSPEHDAGDWMSAAEVRGKLAFPDLRAAFEAACTRLGREG